MHGQLAWHARGRTAAGSPIPGHRPTALRKAHAGVRPSRPVGAARCRKPASQLYARRPQLARTPCPYPLNKAGTLFGVHHSAPQQPATAPPPVRDQEISLHATRPLL